MPQFGDINAKELNSVGTYCKKVLLYGWDSSALAPVKLLCDVSGNLKIDPTNIDSRYLKLDQTTPQQIINGVPIFVAGIRVGAATGDPKFTVGVTGALYSESNIQASYLAGYGTSKQFFLGAVALGQGTIDYNASTKILNFSYWSGFPAAYSDASIHALNGVFTGTLVAGAITGTSLAASAQPITLITNLNADLLDGLHANEISPQHQAYILTAENAGKTLVTGDMNKVYTCDSASPQTFNLPSVGAGDVGMWITIIKLGAGSVIIDAADSDTIADSGVGLTIYNDMITETWATITLMLASETKWVITSSDGTWITTQ
jgi:hypothetical protein